MNQFFLSMAGACLWIAPLVSAADVYKAPDREPTDEETLILEYMNRFRADPAAEAERIAPGGSMSSANRIPPSVDWEMFKKEMKSLKAAPPLVINLDLLDAARKHSYYMIKNELTHVEDPEKAGFVAKEFGARCKAAGYKGFAGAENAFRDAGNPWQSHSGFVVDYGKGGSGGMQDGRGHRTNMAGGGYTEVGASAVGHDGKISVTHNFGSRKAARLVGGVVYTDKNGNGFYDIGEGMGGVEVSGSDGSSATTWKSGAFTLELKSTAAVTISAGSGAMKFEKKYDSGRENVKFDWIVPEKYALEKADKLFAAFEKVKDPATKEFFRAAVALYIGCKGLTLDPERQKRFDSLTEKIGPELDGHQKAVLEALAGEDPAAFSKALAEHRKPYGGSPAEVWFTEVELVFRVKMGVANFEKQKSTPQQRRQFAGQIEASEKAVTTPAFKQEIAALIAKVKGGA